MGQEWLTWVWGEEPVPQMPPPWDPLPTSLKRATTGSPAPPAWRTSLRVSKGLAYHHFRKAADRWLTASPQDPHWSVSELGWFPPPSGCSCTELERVWKTPIKEPDSVTQRLSKLPWKTNDLGFKAEGRDHYCPQLLLSSSAGSLLWSVSHQEFIKFLIHSPVGFLTLKIKWRAFNIKVAHYQQGLWRMF